MAGISGANAEVLMRVLELNRADDTARRLADNKFFSDSQQQAADYRRDTATQRMASDANKYQSFMGQLGTLMEQYGGVPFAQAMPQILQQAGISMDTNQPIDITHAAVRDRQALEEGAAGIAATVAGAKKEAGDVAENVNIDPNTFSADFFSMPSSVFPDAAQFEKTRALNESNAVVPQRTNVLRGNTTLPGGGNIGWQQTDRGSPGDLSSPMSGTSPNAVIPQEDVTGALDTLNRSLNDSQSYDILIRELISQRNQRFPQ